MIPHAIQAQLVNIFMWHLKNLWNNPDKRLYHHVGAVTSKNGIQCYVSGQRNGYVYKD